MSSNYPPPPPTSGYGSPAPGSFDVASAFRWGWKKFQENLGPIIMATVVLIVAVIVFEFISSFITGAIFGAGDLTLDSDTGTLSGERGFLSALVVSLLSSFLSAVVGVLVQAGIIRGALAIADGRKPELPEILATDKIGPTLITAVIISAGTFIGMIFCILPGIVFAVMSSFALYFLLDRDVEPLDAVKASFSFVKNNIGQLVLLYLASIAAIIAGLIVCLVGVLVAIPVVILANTYAYRRLTGGNVIA